MRAARAAETAQAAGRDQRTAQATSPEDDRAEGEKTRASRPVDPARAAAKEARRERRAVRRAAARARRRANLPQTVVSLAASVIVVVFSVGMLYLPAQNFYLAVRERERVTNELNAVNARNDQMQTRVDSLQTREGIEDEARARFGLVLPGENLVKVVGVDDSSQNDFATPAEVPRGSGENTHTWGTDLLDRIFGVDVSATTATPTEDTVAQVTEGSGDAADAGAGADAGTGDQAGDASTGDADAGAGAGVTNENADIVVEDPTAAQG